MLTDNHYKNSLLLLSYLIANVDGILDIQEKIAVKKICEFENISEESLNTFVEKIPSVSERAVYDMGIDEISECTDDEKIRIFAWLHRISEVDGDVHIKEVRFLLYSIKKAGIEFNDVIKTSATLPAIL
jgi:uncharacterized tellurite resistance protein B-like protein